MKPKNLSIFISHAKEDDRYAKLIRKKLESVYEIKPWIYEKDICYGYNIWSEIEKSIIQCDYFFILLTDAAKKSKGVRKELGLVIKLLKERNEPRPQIIGIKTNKKCTNYIFEPMDYYSRRKLQKYDLGKFRYFDSKKESYKSLINRLAPKVTFITDVDGENQDLLEKSFICYKELFPDPKERDKPEDIKKWIDLCYNYPELIPWREVYACLHLNNFVIGMAFISININEHWAFGNYFGIKQGYRQENRAREFIEKLKNKLIEIDCESKGVVFEVEKIDFNCLDEILVKRSIKNYKDIEYAIDNIRRLRRINLYQSLPLNTLAFLDNNFNPLIFIQPSMENELVRENEVDLFLLYYGFSNHNIEIKEVIDFLYDNLYLEAYAQGDTKIEGFEEYLNDVKNRVTNSTKNFFSLGKINIKKKYYELFDIAYRENLINLIDL